MLVNKLYINLIVRIILISITSLAFAFSFVIFNDFLININWKNSNNNDLLIFDAKYSPAASVKEYAIDKLINRYFFGIHQIGKDGSFGRSPTQAVWALYPKRGKNVVSSSFYASEHCLGGSTPLLPSLGGMNLKPSKQNIFKNQLSLLMQKLEP